MNKNLRRLLSCGTAFALCAGIFTSCNDDDDYETRISVLETAVGDLKTQLGKALTSGASVTGVVQNDNGTYTITLSDGQTIQTGGASGAGSDVTVTVTDTSAIINVNGEEYTLPLGAPVSSLKYAPEYLDGMVEIADGKGAQVNFLVRPEIASLDGATFTVAESHELKARVIGEETFKVASAALENGLVKLTLLCLDSDARGSHHAVSVQMNYRGAVIGSDYFTVHVSDDFSFVSEAIDENIKVTAPGATQNPDSKAWTFSVDGGTFSEGYDFATVFSGVPAGAKFRIASVNKQPGGPAQQKQAMLAASLNENGKFAFTERPGTSFNDNAEQAGFLVEVINSELAVVAKTYVTINDPLAGKNVMIPTTVWDQHMEWGTPHPDSDLANWSFLDNATNGGLYLEKGKANSISLPEILLSGQLCLAHGNSGETLKALSEYANDYVYATKKALVLTEDAAKLCKHSAGVRWFNRQLSVVSSERRNWGMEKAEMQAIAGGECNGEIIGGWDGIPVEDIAALGITIADNGTLSTTDQYGGYALRIGIGIELQYDYGTLPISDSSVSYLWIGRRNSSMDVVDVAKR